MYLKGSAIDCTDLLAQLRTFLEGAGWVTDYYAVRSALPNSGVQYSFHKGDLNVTMLSNVGEVANPTTSQDKRGRVYVQIHDAFVASASPEVQPGSSGNQVTNGLTDPIKTFWFFEGTEGGSPYAYVVCEITTGVIKHFHVGKLKKKGQVYETGNFLTCSNWYYNHPTITQEPDGSWHAVPFDDVNNSSSSYTGMVVRLDLGGISPRYWGSNSYFYADSNRLRVGFRGGNDYGTIHALKDWGLSVETGRTPLTPIHTAINRGEGYYSYIGEPPGVRYIDITNYEVGQELAVGSDTWMVFPLHRKIFTPQTPYTGAYGLAYKKVID
ncbi:hypothetical protein DLP3_019 [Stenotrophomonas phage vB_SmaS_DLP_3]|nr:hypothetical protein DLP3_019 [Stenotrophomonas phage vB_SmaS_DLP_3]